MSAASCLFLDTVADRWNEIASAVSMRELRSHVGLSRELGKMRIEVECSTHVALIEAWEHAHCLDVTLLCVAPGVSTMLSAGPCASAGEMDMRLHALRDQLLKSETT